ncbi:MAG: GGDEF domain-containing protein [Spirochaetota bacterium]
MGKSEIAASKETAFQWHSTSPSPAPALSLTANSSPLALTSGPPDAGTPTRGLADGTRLIFAVLALASGVLLPALVPARASELGHLLLAMGFSLYILRGRPLPLLIIPIAVSSLAWLILVVVGLLPLAPILVIELTVASIGVVYTGRRLRRERLKGDLSLSLLEARVLELREMSFRDALTGLYNRRYATEAGHGFVAQSRRYGYDFHALMVDIDHFKRINDELGHPRGDEVLKEIASILRSAIRETDIAARIGGEEFLVLLPKANAESAQNIANRIRDLVGSTVFEGVPWTVTVSLGVTGIRESDELETLVERADSFLYQSKRSGRNRVSGT